jgi:hypothetical protein
MNELVITEPALYLSSFRPVARPKLRFATVDDSEELPETSSDGLLYEWRDCQVSLWGTSTGNWSVDVSLVSVGQVLASGCVTFNAQELCGSKQFVRQRMSGKVECEVSFVASMERGGRASQAPEEPVFTASRTYMRDYAYAPNINTGGFEGWTGTSKESYTARRLSFPAKTQHTSPMIAADYGGGVTGAAAYGSPVGRSRFVGTYRSASNYKEMPRFKDLSTEVQKGIDADLEGLRREVKPFTFGTPARDYGGREANLSGFEGYEGYTRTRSRFEGADWTGPGQPYVCKREFFTVVEDRPVLKARVEYYLEHHLYEQEYVREVRYTGREKTLPVENVEVVEHVERVLEEKAPEPCAPAIMAA